MALDFPRSWQIAQTTPIEKHDPNCSYRITEGGLLCDCHVIYQHPEYKAKELYTTDGVVYNREKANEVDN